MPGGFYALALLAAVNPKYLVLDLLLLDNERPRMMYATLLGTALTISIGLGLADVYVLKLGSDLNTQKQVNAGLDIALGCVLLVLGVLAGRNRLHRRRREKKAGRGADWAQRALREPRPWVAVAVGVVAGIPGGVYLTALAKLIKQDISSLQEVIHVVLFNAIMFCLLLVPFAFLLVWPEGTKQRVRGFSAWSHAHARQIITAALLAAGAYLLVDGLIHVT